MKNIVFNGGTQNKGTVQNLDDPVGLHDSSGWLWRVWTYSVFHLLCHTLETQLADSHRSVNHTCLQPQFKGWSQEKGFAERAVFRIPGSLGEIVLEPLLTQQTFNEQHLHASHCGTPTLIMINVPGS